MKRQCYPFRYSCLYTSAQTVSVSYRMFSFLKAPSKPSQCASVGVEDILESPISQVVQGMQSLHLLDQDDYNIPGAFFPSPSPVCLEIYGDSIAHPIAEQRADYSEFQ